MLLKKCHDQQSWDRKGAAHITRAPRGHPASGWDINGSHPLQCSLSYCADMALLFCKSITSSAHSLRVQLLEKLPLQQPVKMNPVLCFKEPLVSQIPAMQSFCLSCQCRSWLHNTHRLQPGGYANAHIGLPSLPITVEAARRRALVNINFILRLKPFRLNHWVLINWYFLLFYTCQHLFNQRCCI